ncbi:MAG: cytochrome c-type biogenesis protein CcmH [Candidatus Acidiferrales bacterium]|jgi:cytochrome c-type biogenesis protein CcmH
MINLRNGCGAPQNSPRPLRPPSASSALIFAFRAIVLAIVLTMASASPASAQDTPRAKALSKRVLCMCGGCEDSAGMCNHPGGTFSGPCETARGMQKDLDARVTRNESDDQILQAMVEQYGPTVLVEPPKKGFDLLAWIMPIAVPLIALVLVWEVVRRWRHKATLAPAGGPQVNAEFLARAQREAGREGSEHDE